MSVTEALAFVILGAGYLASYLVGDRAGNRRALKTATLMRRSAGIMATPTHEKPGVLDARAFGHEHFTKAVEDQEQQIRCAFSVPRPIPARDGFPFDIALAYLTTGGRVYRKGWNGKDQWLELQRPEAGSKMTEPYIFMTVVRGGSTKRIPWLASQADLLGEDWARMSSVGSGLVSSGLSPMRLNQEFEADTRSATWLPAVGATYRMTDNLVGANPLRGLEVTVMSISHNPGEVSKADVRLMNQPAGNVYRVDVKDLRERRESGH